MTEKTSIEIPEVTDEELRDLKEIWNRFEQKISPMFPYAKPGEQRCLDELEGGWKCQLVPNHLTDPRTGWWSDAHFDDGEVWLSENA